MKPLEDKEDSKDNGKVLSKELAQPGFKKPLEE